MYAVGMLGSYLSQGVYAVAGPFQPFGGAVDILVVQQEDGAFKSSPWYVKFGDFQGVLKRQEKIVNISVNDVPAGFHMILDSTGEAYFEKDLEPDEGTCSMLPDGSSLMGGQEGDIEIVVNTDGGRDCQSHENEGSGSCTGFNAHESSIVGIAEVKIVTREEPWETQQEQVHNGGYGSHMEPEAGGDASQVTLESRIPETTDAIKNNCHLHAPFTESVSDHKPVGRSQKEERNTKDEVKVATSHVLRETHNRDFSSQDAGSVKDIPFTDMTITMDTLFDLEQVSLSTGLLKSDRVNEESKILKEELMPNTTIFSVEESKLQEVLTSPDAEGARKCTSHSEPCLNDVPVVPEKLEKSKSNDLEGICGCEDSSSIDFGLDEDNMLASFECITVEAKGGKSFCSEGNGMNCDVHSECREDRESDSGDVEPSLKQESDDVFGLSQTDFLLAQEDSNDADVESNPLKDEGALNSKITGDAESAATLARVSSPTKWRFWPLLLRWSRIEKASSLSNHALLAATSLAIKPSFSEGLLQNHNFLKWHQKTKLRTYVPTSAQLASLNLKDGPNKVTFTFSSVIGKTQVDARIYLWKWNTKIVISDVDGTITKSDVLGQVMPLVGRDWSQYGVTRLFSAIKDNGYNVLFLSARAISQAYITRRFLLNLKQDGEALPEGPVFISPDGLFPSLYREVIRRAPHEFKISCLEEIRDLFPKDVNPFYAGFGNRDTDEISYLKVGIPEGKIFIINPKGEVVVNHRVDCKSYTSLYALVDEMFPPMYSFEQEEFNEWNFWKVALPDIDNELSTKSSKDAKKVGSSKK